jgi:hypothetical protein
LHPLTSGKYQELSAEENIGLGNINTISSIDSIKQAASASGAHEYIRTFESFYKTLLRYKGEDVSQDMDRNRYYNYDLDPDDDKPVAFMRKMLQNELHGKAKSRGKLIDWTPKPKKKPINVEIPEYRPGSTEEPAGFRALSGGQWQRIALARAFMRMKDADLLILDEPSSALDPQAEYQVFKSIMELRRNKTTIYIVFPVRYH